MRLYWYRVSAAKQVCGGQQRFEDECTDDEVVTMTRILPLDGAKHRYPFHQQPRCTIEPRLELPEGGWVCKQKED